MIFGDIGCFLRVFKVLDFYIKRCYNIHIQQGQSKLYENSVVLDPSLMKNLIALIAALFVSTLLSSCAGGVQFVPNGGGVARPILPPVHFVDAPIIPYGQAARFGYGGGPPPHQQMIRSNPYRDRNQSIAVPVTPPGRNSIGFHEWQALGNGSRY